jgi:leucyl/phenylalanyl-tRNA--protein transferase
MPAPTRSRSVTSHAHSSHRRVPVEPPPCQWELPDPRDADENDIVGIGADLEPATLLAAYRAGLFPMRLGKDAPIAWWSPDPRGVIPLDGFHASRRLRQVQRRFDVTVDTAFTDVVAGCANPARPHGWIDESFAAAYTRLFDMGWAHSVEVWDAGVLAGGLYGLRVGGLFAAESMFHAVRDASKVALWALVDGLRLDGASLLDVQWTTPHLASLGAIDISRPEYLRRLARALR